MVAVLDLLNVRSLMGLPRLGLLQSIVFVSQADGLG
jgi:hypothetical protein